MFRLNGGRNKLYLLKEDQQSHNAQGHAPGMEEMNEAIFAIYQRSSEQ